MAFFSRGNARFVFSKGSRFVRLCSFRVRNFFGLRVAVVVRRAFCRWASYAAWLVRVAFAGLVVARCLESRDFCTFLFAVGAFVCLCSISCLASRL